MDAHTTEVHADVHGDSTYSEPESPIFADFDFEQFVRDRRTPPPPASPRAAHSLGHGRLRSSESHTSRADGAVSMQSDSGRRLRFLPVGRERARLPEDAVFKT